MSSGLEVAPSRSECYGLVMLRVAAYAVGAAAVVGCSQATPAPAPPPATPPEYVALTEERAAEPHLARLRALDILDVGAMIVAYPEGATNCYGPCPGEEAAIEKAADRLAKLVEVAQRAAPSPSPPSCTAEAIDQNLRALSELKIVEIRGLVRTAPANNPACYNTPCEQDRRAADSKNCERAGRLEAIVAGSREL